MLFDSHAHMDVHEFDEDRDELLEKLKADKISYVLNPGVDLETSRNAVKLAEKYNWIYAAVGYHPSETKGMDDDVLSMLESMAKNPRVKAIGEIGLDYYWDKTPRDVQQHWFREQIRLAERLGLPIVIHDREAHGDVKDILTEEKAFERTKVLLHCYSGGAELARQYSKLGCYFSVAGPVTYGNNKKAKAVLEVIPLDHMCIETDSPFLTPEPFRGQRNNPGLVEYTARKIAELKGMTFEEIAAASMETAKRFFGIDD